jgi:hypothetical protein
MLMTFFPWLGAGEPLWGDAERLDAGEATVAAGAWATPVNGYGGDVAPELYGGVGLPGGFDLRAGAIVDVPVYHRDDGALSWGYTGPSFEGVDATARWFPRPSLGFGVRVRRDGLYAWEVDPEVTWSREAGRVLWTVRSGYALVPRYLASGVFGVPSATGAANVAIGERASLFGELELAVLLEMGGAKDGGGTHFAAVEPALATRGGAWLDLDRAGRHRVGLALGWDARTFDPVETLQVGVRYRVGPADG